MATFIFRTCSSTTYQVRQWWQGQVLQRWEQYSTVSLVIYAKTRAKHARHSIFALRCFFQLTAGETLRVVRRIGDMLKPIA